MYWILLSDSNIRILRDVCFLFQWLFVLRLRVFITDFLSLVLVRLKESLEEVHGVQSVLETGEDQS